MPPSLEPLKPCQIKSIEALGFISMFELGLRWSCRPAKFKVLKLHHDVDAGAVRTDVQRPVWRNRISTGHLLLAVPSRALLEYDALEWIVDYKDYKGMPMTLSVRKLVTACASRRRDPVKELQDADCVVVDLRGIARLHPEMRVAAGEVFDDDLWDALGVEGKVTKHATICEVKDFGGTVEMILLPASDEGAQVCVSNKGTEVTEAKKCSRTDLICVSDKELSSQPSFEQLFSGLKDVLMFAATHGHIRVFIGNYMRKYLFQ
ncbi:hypothetical protein SELMODRAFT_408806 [Selaginella moellendorffii]|uniref:Uncharacterized protein n=1 Tax=Selaginella moellendorffii TaxID=88036 RepID=D8RA07_SELML|nr:hypothetical protein SELMODRAFT_408806 [Selaginella moellendorffii]